MKIALVSPYDYAHPGGVMNHVIALSNEFTKMGHEVKILAPTSKRLRETKNFVPMGRATAIAVGGTIIRISPSFRLEPRVKEVLKEEQFDIIHLHEPFMPMLCSTFLKFNDQTIIGTFHASDGRPGYRFGAPLTSILLSARNKNLSGHIAVSKAAKKYAASFVSGDFTIIPNGVDLKIFNPSVEPIKELRDDKINIVYVGRFENRKGPMYLIRAFEILKHEFDNIRLIMVGPGELLRESCEKYVEKHQIEDVEFIGGVGYTELPRWYQTADIFCSPATGQESFGMVLLEAMALGKPIVAANNEGYSQVITDGQDGLLVKPRNSKALALALKRLIEDESLRKELGQNALTNVQQYDWPKVAKRVLDYYQEVLDKKRGA